MGEIVSFAAYRGHGVAEMLRPEMRIATSGSIQESCQDFAAGLQRMKIAARMLSEASSELRALAREAQA